MKYYVIAVEASGDLHASNLIKQLREKDQMADFRAWGGDLMSGAGAKIVKHYRDLAFMGFAEVVLNLKTILGNFKFCKLDILDYQPDVLILVDYPGFNLRIAEFAKKNHIKVVYYITPQVWAWKKGRVKTIRKVVDKMIVILPFEKDFYAKYNMEVDFVGHPLLDALDVQRFDDDSFRRDNGLDKRPIVALLPGSRKQEISKMLSLMLSVTDQFIEYQFVVAGAPSMDVHFYTKIFGTKKVKLIFNQTHEVLHHAHAALVTSGTATLETALLGVPEIVCYRGNAISVAIARWLLDIRFISLVNLIMDKEVVTELIQSELNHTNLVSELKKIILNQSHRSNLLLQYQLLKEKLGKRGASEKAAKIILDFLHL